MTKKAKTKGKPQPAAKPFSPASSKKRNPEEIIPMGDDDFKNF